MRLMKNLRLNYSVPPLRALIVSVAMALITTAHAEELVVLSPHWDGLRKEITTAFSAHTKGTVQIRWLDVGGTSDILRFIQDEQQRAPIADVLFGGGTASFRELTSMKMLEKFTLTAEQWRPLAKELQGAPLHDADGYWHSAMLAGFGILCNTRVIQQLKTTQPQRWRDLAEPVWHSWIALADPRKSGSAHVIIELMLQQYGWDDGWRILHQIRENTSVITSSSSELPWLIATGEVGCGGVVDSYAAHARDYAGERVTFTIPDGEAPVLGDPIGILANAPHKATAEKFVSFILSEEVQALLMARRGSERGPKLHELRHMSVMPHLYTDLGQDLMVASNPFSWRANPNYKDTITKERWHILNDLLGVFLIDAPLQKSASEAVPISLRELTELREKSNWMKSTERGAMLGKWREQVWR